MDESVRGIPPKHAAELHNYYPSRWFFKFFKIPLKPFGVARIEFIRRPRRPDGMLAEYKACAREGRRINAKFIS